MAKLKDLFHVSRPVLFEQDDEAYPYGGQGTCFLCAFDDTPYIVLPVHVIAGSPPESLRILLSDESDEFVSFDQHYTLTPARADDRPATDLTVLRVVSPRVDVSNLPSPVRLERWAQPTLGPSTKLFAVGYPDELRAIDYDGSRIKYDKAVLEFERPGVSALPQHIELEFSTAPSYRTLSGFSGSPVFTISEENGRAACGFAGMLTRERHCLSASAIVSALRRINAGGG